MYGLCMRSDSDIREVIRQLGQMLKVFSKQPHKKLLKRPLTTSVPSWRITSRLSPSDRMQKTGFNGECECHTSSITNKNFSRYQKTKDKEKIKKKTPTFSPYMTFLLFCFSIPILMPFQSIQATGTLIINIAFGGGFIFLPKKCGKKLRV